MIRHELGIVDTRNIIKTLQDVYNYDFKNYALTFFKRRVEKIIGSHNLKDADDFIQKIKSDKNFFELFLQEICVDTTEMFREPSMWRVLKEEIFPKLINESGTFKIWFPEVSSGEELYSTAIILDKLNLLNDVQFIASSISDLNTEKIKAGILDPKKIEINDANYVRVINDGILSEYYSQKNEKANWNTSLIENTKFIKQNVIFDDYPKGIKFVLFRNQMIYFNQILQERYTKIIYNCLVPGGYLAIGNKEKIDYWNSDKDYMLINDSESIYKKKLS